MDSFNLLRRRTTELFQSLEHSLPSMPSLGSGGGGHSGMKGTWEKLAVPPLPRGTSHSADIVAGTLYVFGGAAGDNAMHAITLPSSGAPADYYAIPAKPAKPAVPTVVVKEPSPSPEPPAATAATTTTSKKEEAAVSPVTSDDEEDEDDEEEEEEDSDDDEHSNISLSPPRSPTQAQTQTQTQTATDKGKGKAPAAPLSLPVTPPPRTGHATAVLGPLILLYGGRAPGGGASDNGGPPLNEGGRVWVFDTRTHLWSFLDPAATTAGSDGPGPRAGHTAAASELVVGAGEVKGVAGEAKKGGEGWREWALGPASPETGVLAARAVDVAGEGFGTFIVHGGETREGVWTADVSAFDLRSRVWTRLADAPGKGVEGAVVAVGRGGGVLYRVGGDEGALDFLELSGGGGQNNNYNNGHRWKTVLPPPPSHPGDDPTASWPAPRTAAALQAVTVGGGREYLLLALGRDAAATATGALRDDVWAFQVPAEGLSLASVADTAFSVVGRGSGEGRWARVRMAPHDDEDDESADGPGPRAWVASASMGELEENGVVLFGGVGEGERRLGDGWILRLG